MPDNKTQGKWYFKISMVIITFLCIGPFALPLVWFNPRFKIITKIVVTAITIILSYYLWIAFKSIIKNYQGVFNRFLGQASF